MTRIREGPQLVPHVTTHMVRVYINYQSGAHVLVSVDHTAGSLDRCGRPEGLSVMGNGSGGGKKKKRTVLYGGKINSSSDIWHAR